MQPNERTYSLMALMYLYKKPQPLKALYTARDWPRRAGMERHDRLSSYISGPAEAAVQMMSDRDVATLVVEWSEHLQPVDKHVLDIVLRALANEGRLLAALRLTVAALAANVRPSPAILALLHDAAQETGLTALMIELDAATRAAGIVPPWATGRAAAAAAAPPTPRVPVDFRFQSKWIRRALNDAKRPTKLPAAR